MADVDGEDLRVVDDRENGRYELLFDDPDRTGAGSRRIGFADYRRDGHLVVVPHLEVSTQYGGRGFAGVLARGLLDAVRTAGEQVTPMCPFLAAYLRRHPEDADLVADGYQHLID